MPVAGGQGARGHTSRTSTWSVQPRARACLLRRPVVPWRDREPERESECARCAAIRENSSDGSASARSDGPSYGPEGRVGHRQRSWFVTADGVVREQCLALDLWTGCDGVKLCVGHHGCGPHIALAINRHCAQLRHYTRLHCSTSAASPSAALRCLHPQMRSWLRASGRSTASRPRWQTLGT